MYDVAERLLLRRVQISHNRSLDGILDSLNTRNITDAGPVGLIDDAPSDEDALLPPSAAGAALLCNTCTRLCMQRLPAAECLEARQTCQRWPIWGSYRRRPGWSCSKRSALNSILLRLCAPGHH